EKVMKSCIDVTQKHRVRIIFGTGWNDAQALKYINSDAIYVLSEPINHEWLFERCAGVLHHGGSGSTITGATMGCPTWVFSLFMDQPFWGSRVQKSGFGGHTPYTQFSTTALEKAILCLQESEIVQKAHKIGKDISREAGVENAARFIEEWYPKTPVPKV
ncbi:MAG: hypothetical protein JNN25_03430, partial [Candidatus Kapabacteria bacterium]|nr:hypothetical protein [Candidatus Kapabacteria bacterium]